jgi:hypothetical protein
MPAQVITVNSRWIRKHVAIEVEVTRVTFRNVAYIALDKSFSGTLRNGSSFKTSGP